MESQSDQGLIKMVIKNTVDCLTNERSERAETCHFTIAEGHMQIGLWNHNQQNFSVIRKFMTSWNRSCAFAQILWKRTVGNRTSLTGLQDTLHLWANMGQQSARSKTASDIDSVTNRPHTLQVRCLNTKQQHNVG